MSYRPRDLETFLKLYPRFRVPVPANFDYYCGRLVQAMCRTPPLDYSWLPQALLDYQALEDCWETPAAALEHKQVIVDRIAPLHCPSLPPVAGGNIDKLELAAGHKLVRIDLVSANYSAVRFCDGGLPSTWEELCQSLVVPLALARSKAFRQSVLGLVDPRGQQRLQAWAMSSVAAHLEQVMPLFADRIVKRSPDEIIFKMLHPEYDMRAALAAVELLPKPWAARVETVRLRRLSFMRGYTWEQLDGDEVIGIHPFAVPGNRFYLWLTRCAFGTEVWDVRDTAYLDDGQEGRWHFNFNREKPYVD